jgi:drug/metabolite transporter (DMT)-like permease
VSVIGVRPLRSWSRTESLTADLLLLGTIVLWSFNFTAMRYAISHGIEPLTYAPIRWLLAGAAMSAATYHLEGDLRVRRRHVAALVGLAAVGLWLNQTAVTYASKLTTGATVALLFGTLPVFVALFSRLAGIEHVSARQWLAVVISFLGVGLIAGGAEGGFGTQTWGILLGLASAATFAAFSVAMVPMMRRYSPYRLNALTGLIGAVLLAVTGAWQLADQNWHVGALAWAAVLYGALASAALGNLLWFKAVRNVGAGRAALYVNMQPFLGAVFAVLVLSETLDTIQIAGAVVVGAAILLVRVRPTGTPAGE